MTIYYSASANAFYSSDITATSSMPSDKVALTDAEYSSIMEQQAAGYRIVANTSTGKPQAVAQGLTDATGTEHEGVVATGSVLGHVKLSDSTSSSSGASAGVAATPAAVKAVNDAKAPTSHASTGTTYGIGTGSNYGHVKLSDSTSTTSGASAGIAATPTAVKAVNDAAVHKTGDETIAGTKTFSSTISGSVSGNAGTATKLAAARTIQTKLDSTSSASFDGSGNVTPGVTGVLPVANGGTGSSTKNFVDLTSAQTVAGVKTFNNAIRAALEGFITSNSNDKAIRISGATDYVSGASVIVYGKDHAEYPGVFRLRTTNGTDIADLDAWPNGEITWEGKNLVRSVNGTAADTAGNVALTPAIIGAAASSHTHSYLPLGGGKMTGGINTEVEGIIVGSSDTVALRMSGGTDWYNGASVVVYGKSHATYPGVFRVKASDGTNEKILLGKPDGTLTWGGNKLLTSICQSLNADSATTLTPGGSWTSTGNGMVFFWCDNGTGWGGATLYLNGVKIGYHYGKESGGTLCCPVKTGDVVKMQLDSTYTRQGAIFVPYNN